MIRADTSELAWGEYDDGTGDVAATVAELRNHVTYAYVPARVRKTMNDAADLLERLSAGDE